MKIAILRGSPCRRGSSNLLADHFIRGAKESGHEIINIDVAHADVHPCIGCKACGFDGKPLRTERCNGKNQSTGIDGRYAGICYAVVLFWNVCTAQNMS